MANQLPDPFVAEQFSKFLEILQDEIATTLTKMEALKAEDPEHGYARALGTATAHMHSILTLTQTSRQIYFDA